MCDTVESLTRKRKEKQEGLEKVGNIMLKKLQFNAHTGLSVKLVNRTVLSVPSNT